MEVGEGVAGQGAVNAKIPMNAERWEQVKTIFHHAVECATDTWAQLLEQSCGDDRELRTEVESLLSSDREARTLLNPSYERGERHTGGGAGAKRRPDDWPRDWQLCHNG